MEAAAAFELACRPSPRLKTGLILWCLILSGACAGLVDCAVGWRMLAVAAIWGLVWPAGRQCVGQGGARAVTGLSRSDQGSWALRDRQGLHYVELMAPPLRLGPLFWFTFRSPSGRWHVCLDAKLMEPVALRALQLMVRELPVIRDRPE